MSGIEIVGLAASVIQIAELGGKLSVKLFTFTRKVKNANRSIDALSRDIAGTGAVLKQLGETLSQDKSLKVCSQEAVDAAKTLVEDTKGVFTDLEKLIDSDEKSNSWFFNSITFKQKLKFPFLQPQIEQVQANLERLKSSLLVILNVLIFAEQLRNQEALPILKDQRELIKVLAAEKDENEKRHERILKALSDKATVHSSNSADTAADPDKRLDHNFATISPASTLVTDTVPSPSLDLMSQPASEDLPTSAPVDLPPGLRHHQQRIQHHSELVQNLVSEIKSLRYDLDHGTRHRMHSGVLAIHWNEWAAQRRRYGHENIQKILERQVDVARYWTDKKFLEETLHEEQDLLDDGKVLPTVPTTEISEYLDRSTEYVEETDLAILRGLKVSRVGTIADRDAKVVVEVEEDSSSDLDSDIMREESEIFNDVNKLVLQFTNIETWELDSLRQSE